MHLAAGTCRCTLSSDIDLSITTTGCWDDCFAWNKRAPASALRIVGTYCQAKYCGLSLISKNNTTNNNVVKRNGCNVLSCLFISGYGKAIKIAEQFYSLRTICEFTSISFNRPGVLDAAEKLFSGVLAVILSRSASVWSSSLNSLFNCPRCELNSFTLLL